MNIAFFDCFAGINGDVVIGAFLNAGMPLEHLQSHIDKLPFGKFILQSHAVVHNAIATTTFSVNHSDTSISASDAATPTIRLTFADSIRLIAESNLQTDVKKNAHAILQTLAKAESHVQQVPLDNFLTKNECSTKAVVDIVGAAIGLAYFHIDAAFSSVIKIGGNPPYSSGVQEEQLVPSPATIEILRDYPISFGGTALNDTTPVGAAIIKTMSRGILSDEPFSITAIGYGLANDANNGRATMLRLIIGAKDESFADTALLLETNIDNLNPEIYPYVIERLMEAGAFDAFLTPIVMKKGRPAIKISALAPEHLCDAIVQILYEETTTAGVRILQTTRKKLQRKLTTAATAFGEVKIKEIYANGGVRRMPEYEECRRIARAHRAALRDVQSQLFHELNPEL